MVTYVAQHMLLPWEGIMPPKPVVGKEEIITAAVALVRQHGMGGLNARSLAAALGCSTKPLFRVYESMEALKEDAFIRLNGYYNRFMEERMEEGNRLLTQSVAYIAFARQEKEIFNTLFMDKCCAGKTLVEIQDAWWNQRSIENAEKITGLTHAEARALFRDMWLYAHGIATQIVANDIELSGQEVIQLMEHAFCRFSKRMEG